MVKLTDGDLLQVTPRRYCTDSPPFVVASLLPSFRIIGNSCEASWMWYLVESK